MTKTMISELSVLVISAVGLIASAVLTSPIVATLSAIVLFSAFDAIGYYRLGVEGSTDKLPYYRTLQVVFQHILTAFLLFTFGWQFALIYNVAWWFGVCDILYYLILRQNYFNYGPMSWLWWTPFGIISKMFDSSPSPMEGTIQAIIGLGISVLLYFVL